MNPVKPVPPKKTAPPGRARHTEFTDRHLRVEPLPVPLEGPQVRQQVPLHNRQLLQGHVPPAPLKQRLDQIRSSAANRWRACRDRRMSRQTSWRTRPRFRRPSRTPSGSKRPSSSEVVQFARPCSEHPQVRPPVRRQVGTGQPAQVVESRPVPAKELHLKPEPLRAHVQRRQVNRLQLFHSRANGPAQSGATNRCPRRPRPAR